MNNLMNQGTLTIMRTDRPAVVMKTTAPQNKEELMSNLVTH